jgi:hypothetical protein
MNIRVLGGKGARKILLLKAIWTVASIGILAICAVGQSDATEAEISQALSASPASIAAHASVVVLGDKGSKKELRAGTNGWTCMTRDLSLPEDGIAHHPACFDKYGLEWIENYMAGREPDPGHVGYSYMLQGGSSWSNTDPKAAKLAPGQKAYIRMPPHIMILSAKVANASGLPSGQSDPDTGKPFVMFGGTSVAIVIIPVN